MKSSARRVEPAPGFGALLREGLYLSGAAMARNPSIVGGATAFAVATAFVWANAVWYQPHAHPGAFFETRIHRMTEEPPAVPRPAPAPVLSPVAEPAQQRFAPHAAMETPVTEETTAAVPQGDPAVQQVQDILRGLDLYDGDIDGIAGPKTTAAVQTYQRVVGLAPTGMIDAQLLEQLGASPSPSGTASEVRHSAMPPLPTPRPSNPSTASVTQPQSDPRVVKVQAGLRAFGNDDIDLDGIVGAKTKAGIREFQALFGLRETGEPNEEVYAKMREIGLTD